MESQNPHHNLEVPINLILSHCKKVEVTPVLAAVQPERRTAVAHPQAARDLELLRRLADQLQMLREMPAVLPVQAGSVSRLDDEPDQLHGVEARQLGHVRELPELFSGCHFHAD